tara:strand:- start:22 stop:1119 length:1098 start_codon:yes stop_codon:yes gene_type:complete
MKVRSLIPVLLLGVVSCGGSEVNPTQSVAPIPTSITLTRWQVTLDAIGDTVVLLAIVADQYGRQMPEHTVQWASSDNAVATVIDGKVTAVGNGTAQVLVTSGALRENALVNVTQVPTSISLSRTSLTLRYLYTPETVVAVIKDRNGHELLDALVEWDSSDDGVVTVSTEGTITPVGEGTSAVSATSGWLADTVEVVMALSDFHLAYNGVTVICTHARIGGSGVVGGVTYYKRNRKGDLRAQPASCTSGVTDMSSLFYEGEPNGDIGHWDVSSVTNMRQMFNQSTFNGDIALWDVRNVTNMDYMFTGNNRFGSADQDLSGWCTPKMSYAIVGRLPLGWTVDTSGYGYWRFKLPLTRHPIWGTCPGG